MAALLEGKVALVTGGGSGIGRATALAFAREGAALVVADVSEEGGAETARLVRVGGGRAHVVVADVSQQAAVEAMVREAMDNYGRLDCAFNNAGIAGAAGTTTVDYTERDWDMVMSINLKGVWLCMKYEIPQMLAQGAGAIVNTSSVAGLVGIRGSSAYVASKHGVAGLTKTAALEYAQRGVRVNAVCPGVIRTPLYERNITLRPEREAMYVAGHPLGRIGEPEEVAGAVVWLCSDAASFVTGHTMVIDGGWVAQ